MSCAPALTQNPPGQPRSVAPDPFTSVLPAQTAGAGQQSWKQFFDDPERGALIDSALANNQELSIRQQ